MTLPNVSLVLIMVLFWLAYWLVNRLLVRPFTAVLDERRERIHGAQARAASATEDATATTTRIEQELDDAAREAGRVRGQLRQAAVEDRNARLERTRREASDRLEAALAELDEEATAARRELRQRAEDLARLFATQLLDREVAS